MHRSRAEVLHIYQTADALIETRRKKELQRESALIIIAPLPKIAILFQLRTFA